MLDFTLLYINLQPPKQQAKGGKAKPTKPSGGKAKKKKWSKGKTRDKLANLVLFDKATQEKFLKEVKISVFLKFK